MAVSILRLPLASVVLALLLTGSAGAAIAPIIIIIIIIIVAVVVAYITIESLPAPGRGKAPTTRPGLRRPAGALTGVTR